MCVCVCVCVCVWVYRDVKRERLRKLNFFILVRNRPKVRHGVLLGRDIQRRQEDQESEGLFGHGSSDEGYRTEQMIKKGFRRKTG